MAGRQKLNVSEEVLKYRKKFVGNSTPRSQPNFRSVTVKQLHLAAASDRHGGRFVLSNSQLYTVVVCGRLESLDQTENHTNFRIFDGTGAVEGRIWAWRRSGTTDFSGGTLGIYYTVVANVVKHHNNVFLQAITARKVVDHNYITMHMLQVIHEDCMLAELNVHDLDKWERAQEDADKFMRSCLTKELDKEAIVSFLASSNIRESISGAPSAYILNELHLGHEEGWETLRTMLDEGSIYNTTDYDHFKLADEK